MIEILYLYEDWGLLALRVALGLLFVSMGWKEIKGSREKDDHVTAGGTGYGEKVKGGVTCIGGLMIIFGLLTQIGAMLVFIRQGIELIKKRTQESKQEELVKVLVLAAALVLIFSGGGSVSLEKFFYLRLLYM